MRAVPLDLKRRIVEAYERKEGRYFELAKRFGVGEATVYRALRLKRELGSIEPAEAEPSRAKQAAKREVAEAAAPGVARRAPAEEARATRGGNVRRR